MTFGRWILLIISMLAANTSLATDLTGVFGSGGSGRFARCAGAHLAITRTASSWGMYLRENYAFRGCCTLYVDEDGASRVHLDIRTVVGGKRHADFRGQELFDHMLEHLDGQYDGVRGTWLDVAGLDTNLKQFNAKFSEVYPALLREANGDAEAAQKKAANIAAAHTWTGEQARAHGMTVVEVARLVGVPGRFTDVDVNFDFPVPRNTRPSTTRAIRIDSSVDTYVAMDSEDRRFAIRAIRDEKTGVLTITSDCPRGKRERSPVFDQAAEVKRALEYFSDRPPEKVIWRMTSRAQMDELARLLASPFHLRPRDAVLRVLRGQGVLERGFEPNGRVRARDDQEGSVYLEIELERVRSGGSR